MWLFHNDFDSKTWQNQQRIDRFQNLKKNYQGSASALPENKREHNFHTFAK